LVNNVIDLAGLETGKIEWQPHDTSLHDLVEEVLASFRHITEKKGVALEVNYAKDFPSYALLDAIKVKQMLFNLVGNAVKFTAKGAITIKAGLVQNSNGEKLLEFLVSDTGKGISKDKQHQLFKPYTQINHNQVNSSGLGLSIVKQLCELIGGSVHYIKSDSEGAEFKVLLPFTATKREMTEKKEKPVFSVNIKKMLIADDDDINCKVLSTYCKKYGIEAKTVNTGSKALKELAIFDCDLIILDYYMPEMDGLTTLMHIKKDPRFKEIPVFMLTGDTSEKVRDKLYANGVTKVITKPIEPHMLLSLISDTAKKATNLVNLEYLYKIADNNAEMVQELVNKFLNVVPHDLKKMEELYVKGEYEELRKLFHKSKINMKYVGMDKAFITMEKLEEILVKGNLPNNFEEELSALILWIKKAIQSLKDQC
jgi:CheY-like chemotaxis protein